jgi:uncharacterized membrane protein YeaQ/YmgE (transglycosylase-associated protein family)
MSIAFLVAAFVGTLLTGIVSTLGCRDRSCFFTNLLAAAVGAFALTLVAKQIGVGYSKFGVDFGTGLVFAIVGGMVALLFATMVREFMDAAPEQPRRAATPVRHAPGNRKRQPTEQQLACADFQNFLQATAKPSRQ